MCGRRKWAQSTISQPQLRRICLPFADRRKRDSVGAAASICDRVGKPVTQQGSTTGQKTCAVEPLATPGTRTAERTVERAQVPDSQATRGAPCPSGHQDALRQSQVGDLALIVPAGEVRRVQEVGDPQRGARRGD